MRLSYYPETDSLYIGFSERPSADVVRVSEDVAVDVDEQGVPVGIDIEANASRIADLTDFEVEGVSLAALAFKSREGAPSERAAS